MHKIITLLLHPFSFLLLGVFILFNTNTYLNFSFSDQLKLTVYAIIFFNTMVLPLLFAWYLVVKGQISSILMEDVNDRKMIYFLNFILYLITLFLLSALNVPGVIYKYIFGATMTVGTLFVLALMRKKLSAHLAAIGGLAGALAMLSMRLHTDFLILVCFMVLLAGISGMSRLALRAHKENEIYWGFLLGFLAQIFIYI